MGEADAVGRIRRSQAMLMLMLVLMLMLMLVLMLMACPQCPVVQGRVTRPEQCVNWAHGLHPALQLRHECCTEKSARKLLNQEGR